MKLHWLAAILGAGCILAAGVARGEDGVSAAEVAIGMANALEGPSAGLGTALKAGAVAYFNKLNASGGIHGRKVKLVSYDDGYEPTKSAEATRRLIEQDRVFALFGYVGTPTSTAVVPIASKAGVPYVAPFTGAEFLRNPVNKLVFNVRASYFDETEAMVERLTQDLGVKRIAVFIQDDSFGEAGKAGVNRALHKRNMKLVAEGRYKRNTLEVEAGLEAVKKEKPEAVVMVGTYQPLALFVKKAKAAGFTPKFLTVSFVGTADFIRAAGADGEGVVITQVMPSPFDGSVPIVKRYQADMKAAGRSAFDYGSLEGYVDAAVLAEALKQAGRELTRAGFVKALEGLNADLGGIKVSYSETNHQGMKEIFLTTVKGGKPVPASKL